MFTIYYYNCGGRIHNRYFQKWENAKKLLLEELEGLKKSGWKVTRKTERMNSSKGFYEFQYDLLTPNNEKATLALLDGYFAD